jgi:Aspartyl protease
MSHSLDFETLLAYDVGAPGIIVAVVLELRDQRVSFDAKIDTGADHCIFERKFGEQLGLDNEKGVPQRFGTATGTFLAYGHEVRLQIADITFDSMVFFAADESFTRNVLGRYGWLDRVALGLFDYEGKLYLSPYNNK